MTAVDPCERGKASSRIESGNCQVRLLVSPSKKPESVDVGFIRLLFKPRIEEEIAHRWAVRLGRLLGPRVMDLRPSTTLSELLEWAAKCGAESMEFALVFEPELRMDFAEFLDHAKQVTFRDLVEHYAVRFQDCT